MGLLLKGKGNPFDMEPKHKSHCRSLRSTKDGADRNRKQLTPGPCAFTHVACAVVMVWCSSVHDHHCHLRGTMSKMRSKDNTTTNRNGSEDDTPRSLLVPEFGRGKNDTTACIGSWERPTPCGAASHRSTTWRVTGGHWSE